MMMKLHEAIVEVLTEYVNGLKPSQIAEIINQRKTYIRGDNYPLPSSQISARINKYLNLFTKGLEGKILLKKNIETSTPKAEHRKNSIYSPPTELASLLETFKQNQFDPSVDSDTDIADKAGNYIICLKQDSKLPPVSIEPEFASFEGLNVIYTGIAGSSLRNRDYRQHFTGNNAGRSTLRKSLGALFGFQQIPRDSDPTTGKTKFGEEDEQILSDWMEINLIMFYTPTKDYGNFEIPLINLLNPPLNLQHNHNSVNTDFRILISTLRNKKA